MMTCSYLPVTIVLALKIGGVVDVGVVTIGTTISSTLTTSVSVFFGFRFRGAISCINIKTPAFLYLIKYETPHHLPRLYVPFSKAASKTPMVSLTCCCRVSKDV